MKSADLLASLALHAVFVGAVALVELPQFTTDREEMAIPICFEVVEEAAIVEDGDETAPPPMLEDETPVADMPVEEAPVEEEPVADVPVEDMPAEVHAVEEVPPADPEQPAADIPDVPSPAEEVSEQQPERQVAETVQPESDSASQEERAKVVSDPVALNRVVPVYPRSARRKGHEGGVTVEICVAADGAVTDAEIVESSGHAELDEAALGAARTARFAPATVDGVSVSGRIRLTFDFRLK